MRRNYNRNYYTNSEHQNQYIRNTKYNHNYNNVHGQNNNKYSHNDITNQNNGTRYQNRDNISTKLYTARYHNGDIMSSNWDKLKREISIGEEVDYKLKSELIDYLYANVDIYQVRFCMLRTTEHANQLKQQIYNITPHFHGYNYFLIFKKLSNNIVDAYLVYRMGLKFKRTELDVHNIKIYKLPTNYEHKDIINQFDNTILDGKLIFKKDDKIFLVSDVLYYKNTKYLTHKITDKIMLLDTELGQINNILKYNFETRIIKLYKYADMSDLIYNKIRNSDYKINGLVFLPNRTGKNYVYVNDNEFELIKKSPNLEVFTDVTNIKLPNNIDLHDRKLLLQKTQIVDVYEVYTLDKTIRFGICAIPNMELSHKLRSHFNTNNQLIVDCEFDNKFSKWKPKILNN